MGQLAEIIDEVASGKVDAHTAADRIRGMRLSLPNGKPPTIEDALGAADDPWDPEVEDGGHELGHAFHSGTGRSPWSSMRSWPPTSARR